MSQTPDAAAPVAPPRGLMRGLPYLFLLITTLTWAGHVVVAKGLSGSLPPVALAFWRTLIATLILLPLGWTHVRRDWAVIRRSLPALAMIAVPSVALFNLFLYEAVETTTAINVSLISTTMPAMIILLAWLILKQRLHAQQLAGMLLSAAGALLVIMHGDWYALAHLEFVRGDLWMVAAVAATALYSVLLHFRPPIHSLSLALMMFLIGTPLLLPVYLWDLYGSGHTFTLTAGVAAGIGYIALFPSVIAYLCWNRGIEMVGASRAGLFMNFIPVFVAMLAYLFLDEMLYWYHPTGLLIILCGVFLFNRLPATETRARP